MKKLRALLTASILLLLCGIFFMTLPAGANGQDDRTRKIRQKDKSLRVGVTSQEINTSSPGDMRLWAVLIGVSRYKYGDQEDSEGNLIPNLRYADTDARELYNFLRSP
ncbi:MAG TPA: hypothetical protein VNO14_06595, partial [Blastocatellia bacterium]|nr:hypothetical protein [Blastocatellia bacterium]